GVRERVGPDVDQVVAQGGQVPAQGPLRLVESRRATSAWGGGETRGEDKHGRPAHRWDHSAAGGRGAWLAAAPLPSRARRTSSAARWRDNTPGGGKRPPPRIRAASLRIASRSRGPTRSRTVEACRAPVNSRKYTRTTPTPFAAPPPPPPRPTPPPPPPPPAPTHSS